MIEVLYTFFYLLRSLFVHSADFPALRGACLLLALVFFFLGFLVGLLVCSLARKRSRD